MVRHRAGDPRARALMIERYLPLARSLARRYYASGEPMDDLVQVASLGLIKAVDRWDPDRGLAFSTYAVPTIQGELRRYFRDATWLVRPPRELLERSLAAERARAQLGVMLGHEPTHRELAEHLGWSVETVEQAVQAGRGRWTTPLSGDRYADASQTAHVEQAEGRVTLEGLLGLLDPPGRAVVRLRFEHDLQQAQIALRVGRSQTDVSRIIRASLAALRLHAAATR
jgi:RNA polymerase sigma-B factor